MTISYHILDDYGRVQKSTLEEYMDWMAAHKQRAEVDRTTFEKVILTTRFKGAYDDETELFFTDIFSDEEVEMEIAGPTYFESVVTRVDGQNGELFVGVYSNYVAAWKGHKDLEETIGQYEEEL